MIESKINGKIYRMLTGKSFGIIALFAMSGLFLLFGCGAIYFLVTHFDNKSGLSLGLYVFMILLYAFLIFMVVTLVYRLFKHSNDLREKYRLLGDEERQYVVNLASDYKGSSIQLDSRYIYGKMSRISKGSIISRNVITFEYLPLEQVMWVYFINPRISPRMEATIVGACMGLVLGERLSDSPRMYQDIEHMVQFMKFEPRTEKTMCVFLRDGTCYKGVSMIKDYNQLREIMKYRNPSCKFGFSKEILEEFK